jgi:hypothetical protein
MACSSRATDEPFTIYYIDHQGIFQEHAKEDEFLAVHQNC